MWRMRLSDEGLPCRFFRVDELRAAERAATVSRGDAAGSVFLDGSAESLRAATAKSNVAAGRFLGAGEVEELAVGSVPLSPSSPSP